MTDKEKQAIFQDLYELYQEGELGDEASSWMQKHEEQWGYSFVRKECSLERSEDQHDYKQMKRMKGFIFTLYVSFILLSIWMTVWFYF
ncbi:hypothetical protein [Bacillus sp. 179-C3.3 HS]|uniref:hypothetical protein n=1 Tax=Bacillus sp. 179-C3.3 HS TaxID=3232162 RepID=UPI0039A0506C